MPKTIRYPLTFGVNEPVAFPIAPHDCVIERVTYDEHELVFRLEEDITVHDGMSDVFPGAKSLVIRFHLCDPLILICEEKRPDSPGGKLVWEELEPAALTENTVRDGWKLEYLYHWIGYRSMVIQLWRGRDINLRLDADWVEYEWVGESTCR